MSETSFPPEDQIQKNMWYTAEELLRMMIVHSDNNAMQLLWQDLDQNILSEIFTDLGLGAPVQNATASTMSVKTYSYFFRLLYNASYLNREMSEKALTLLSQTTFREGIAGGVSQDIPMAHKFGERTVVAPNNGPVQYRELHDCGIVYHPDHPYLLCIMTKGLSFSKLSQIMRDISSSTFSYKEPEQHS